jgi:hypothetical protein
MVAPKPEHQDKTWNRLALWFFGIGTLVPVILLIVGLVLSERVTGSPEGTQGTILGILMWVIWPTWIVLIDAEHWYNIIFLMLIAALLNGVWYGIVSFALWNLGRGLGG